MAPLGSPRSSWGKRWRKRKHRYAIGNRQTPWPVFADVLMVFGDMDPWRIASWFESTNAWLDGKRPRDALSDADAVLLAANQKGNRSVS